MSRTDPPETPDVSNRPDISSLGYEQARDELIEVVRMLERGGLDLDTSIALWERGESLADRCEQHLTGARERIESAIARHSQDDETNH